MGAKRVLNTLCVLQQSRKLKRAKTLGLRRFPGKQEICGWFDSDCGAFYSSRFFLMLPGASMVLDYVYTVTVQLSPLQSSYGSRAFILHYITLRYITLHYITLRYITLHYITLHYITLHYITLHYITLHYITLHYITLHYITLHYITLHYITLHYITPGQFFCPYRVSQKKFPLLNIHSTLFTAQI